MIKLLTSISQKIWQKKIYQYIFFALASLITILLMGYYFGTFDQAIHIPDLKKFSNPSLYPNDKFLEIRNYHYSFFWFFFIPFYRIGMLEIVMFITHFFATFITFWAIWKLAKTLFNSPIAPFLAVIAFIFPHLGFAGFPIFEFSLLNRTFVLPFLLIAINLYLNKKTVYAFLILGLMYNLHVISVNFLLAMFIFDSLLRIREIGIKNFIKQLFTFLLFASPVLIWKFSNSHVDVGLDRSWFYTINNSLLAHLFTYATTNILINFTILNGIATIFIFFLTLPIKKTDKDIIIRNFIFTSIIILIVQVIAGTWLPLTIIIQSQIIRVGLFINFFAYLYFASYIANLISSAKIQVNKIYLLITALIFSISPLIALISLLIHKRVDNDFAIRINKYLIIITFLITLIILNQINIWKPGINIGPIKDDNYYVQMWAKNNTPKDTIFITPPALWWFYSLEWRVISERSTVSTLSEVLEGAFFPSYISYWQPRFEEVAPGALTQFSQNALKNIEITKKAYNTLTEKDILRISDKYGAKYFVSEKPNQYKFPVTYQNNVFTVYLLSK
ncbi:MAG: hypothetical protein ACD_12C00008G0002 [uncultured bacterium]|nr:MAG: hypothetical protein ACD_12C00008G0002 [uncultured bacterium]